tara:strand:+ start:1600 stop:2094 length:495 start_codon:yes stop_codon:yes gene_type:complete
MGQLIAEQSECDGKVILKLIGDIDDTFDCSHIELSGCQSLQIDLDGILMINSLGIQRWIRWFATIPEKVSIDFVNCPARVITHMNLISEFVRDKKLVISSFYAPYFCEDCEQSKSFHIIVKEHFQKSEPIEVPKLSCPKCRVGMDFDGLPYYFEFLNRQLGLEK